MPELNRISKALPDLEADPRRPGEYFTSEGLFRIGDELADMLMAGQLQFVLDLPFLQQPIRLQAHHQTVVLGLGRKPDELVIELSAEQADIINQLTGEQRELATLMGAGWMQRYRERNQRGG